MKRFTEITLLLALSWLSVEILLRRWLWQQWPTQVSPIFVYALLAANVLLVWSVYRNPPKSRGI